jgi:hypothetical protein
MDKNIKVAISVGYPEDGAGYLVMDLDTLQVRTEGYVDFIETEFPVREINWDEIEGDDCDDDFVDDDDDIADDEEET